jgi:translation initiation factor IF-2
MSDEDDNNGSNPPSGGRAPLTLKPRGGAVSAGTVRQSFSHGRSKTVVVETKRRRVDAPIGGRASEASTVFTPPPRPAAPPAAAAPRPPEPARPAAGASNLNLSQSELAARQRAIETARHAEEQRAAEEAARRREAEAQQAEVRRAEALRAQPVETQAPAAASAPAPAEPAVQVVQAPVAAPAPAATPASPAPTPTPVAAAPAPTPAPPAAPAAPRPERAWERLSNRQPTPREPRAAPEGRTYTPPPRRDEGARPAERPQTTERSYGDRPQGDRSGGADRPRDAASGGYGARAPRPQGERPSGGYGERAPRPAGDRPAGGYGERAPRPAGDRPAGGYGERGPRPEAGGTVRYSALSPRPAGPRPGGPGGFRPAATTAPSAPELAKTSRSAPPRAGERARPADDDDNRRRGPGTGDGKAVSRTRGEPKRREGRLTIQAVAGDEDSAERMRSLASVRRAREREREKRTKGAGGNEARTARDVVIPDAITIQDLAGRMAVRGVDIIKYLMRQGTMVQINDVLDADTAELIASEFGHTVKRVSESDVETGFIGAEDIDDHMLPRPPVVAVMGHVDHGKTSLLDALRSADVAGGEHGGITQHIGAYQVRLPDGESVTFLDTPGHAAFSAMRMRGANVTDIVILVVAADDGVMPQTIEAINHAKAAGAPIIVAVNKIDKPDADPTRVVNELLQHEIVAESLGGETQIIEVSATKKMGLENLIEAILLQAEVMDLRANPDRSGEGVVIESKLDKGRGPVATVLVKRGTLKRSDIVVAGAAWGRVRALVNERNEQVPTAGPSVPVEILGLDETPDPGEAFAVVENEARARELTEYRQRVKREKTIGPVGGNSLADMMAKLSAKKVSELPVVIKADVGGSAEAIVGSLDKLGTDEVRARIIHSAAGAITESDVLLAKGAGAPILGFNVRASKQARDLAEREGVEIRYYAIIYDLIDDIKGVLSGMLSPIQRETFLGNADVLQVFDISKVGKIAGCRVSDGVVRKGARVRIIREDIVVLELGTLQTLKRFKDEVNEVVAGQECGMAFQGFQDIKQGDTIECFTLETIQRTL